MAKKALSLFLFAAGALAILCAPAAADPIEDWGTGHFDQAGRVRGTVIGEGEQLGEAPFVGDRFLFFCSGHGVAAEKGKGTLIVASDSLVRLRGNLA